MALKAVNEIEEQKVQRGIMKQLFEMSRHAWKMADDAEGAALRSKLASLAIQEELRVRIEILDDQIGDREELDSIPTREDFKADQADLDRKSALDDFAEGEDIPLIHDTDEHEDNPGAA